MVWATRARLTRVAIFVLVAVILVVPSLSFLIQAVSPRLFGQGSSWLTWFNVSQALWFGMGRAVLDSLWVSLAAALMGTVAAAGSIS